MRIPMFLCNALLRYLKRRTSDVRPPDVHIGGKEMPTTSFVENHGYPARVGTPVFSGTYMERWWVIPRVPKRINIYLHRILRSDDDRALHDHPGWSISIVLAGGYFEVMPVDPAKPLGDTITYWRPPGFMRFRKAQASHRLVLPAIGGEVTGPSNLQESWSLFIMGPAKRVWGFWCPSGWRPWQEFTGVEAGGSKYLRGPGCGED